MKAQSAIYLFPVEEWLPPDPELDDALDRWLTGFHDEGMDHGCAK
jgi:hypothetical protein